MEEGGYNQLQTYFNENDLISRIEDELKYDPLYNHIKERPSLKKELLNERFISALETDFRRLYSIAESGRILGDDRPISPSSLKHYIDNLAEYILPEDTNSKFIRLNYLSIFKLKMIWLLKDELKMSGLQAELGIIGTPITTQSFNQPPAELNNDLIAYKKMTQVLAQIFLEQGIDGRPQLKKELSLLLENPQKLLESGNIQAEIEKQSENIQKIEELVQTESKKMEEVTKEFNKQLKEKEEKIDELKTKLEARTTEELSQIKSELDEEVKRKLEENESKFQKIVERTRKQSKAKELAEEEWDKQGVLAKMFGNRSEFIQTKTQQFLKQLKNSNE
jgi:hypothetical protein